MTVSDNRNIIVEIYTTTQKLTIEDLAISFSISKETANRLTDGKVDIHNVNQSTENLVTDNGIRIVIKAGWNGITGIILDGEIRKIDKTRQGLNRILSISLSGKLTAKNNSRFTKSYKGKVSLRQIVQDIVVSTGLMIGDINQIPNIDKSDYAYDGRSYDCLEQLLKDENIQFYEDDGVIKFSKLGVAVSTDDTVISSDTGLNGIPVLTERGVELKTRLNPTLMLGQIITIESDALKILQNSDKEVKKFKITKLTHQGGSRDAEMTTGIVANNLNG